MDAVKLTKAAKDLVEDTRAGAGLLRVDYRVDGYPGVPYLEAAVDLWVAGAIELLACGTHHADFGFTKDGEELARVVGAS